jgi:glutaredoxin
MSKYRVIGADYCPFCIKVKNYLLKNKADLEWIDSETPEGEIIREKESAKYQHYTIPIVFVDGKFVGGCN